MKMQSFVIWCIIVLCLLGSGTSKTLENDFDIFELLSHVIQVDVLDTTEVQQLQSTQKLSVQHPVEMDYTVEQCVEATNNLTSNLFTFPNNLLMSFSWKDIDDLGNYFACTEELRGIAQYYSLNINLTDIPFYLRSGMCMPVQCTQTMLNEVALRLNSAFAAVLIFLSQFEELEIIAKYNIRLGYNFVAPRKALNQIRMGKEVPAIMIALVFLSFLVYRYVTLFIATKDEYKVVEPISKAKPTENNKYVEKDEEHKSLIISGSIQHQEKELSSDSDDSDYFNETTVADDTKEIRLRVGSFEGIQNNKSVSLLDSNSEIQGNLMRNTLKVKSKIFEGIKNVTHQLSEVEHTEVNNAFLDKGKEKSKSYKLVDLKVMNCIYCILTVWGLAISTPYYLLAAPLYNVWRFLILFGQYLVVAVFSGHCVPELIILCSSFIGFVYFATKFETANYSVLKFLKVSGFILLKKYIKFFVLTMAATGFTFYISPFILENASYYSSGISYETCYNDWWWNLLMVGNLSPSSYYGMSGCLPWLWTLSAIFQFWCLMPWIILLHYKSRWLVYTLLTVLGIFSILYTMHLVYVHDFKVGVLAFENLRDNVFDTVIKSPFTKLHLLLMSFAFSRFYLAIQDHKRNSRDVQSKVLKKIYKKDSYLFTFALWGTLFVVFFYYLIMGRAALMNPYAWSRWHNTLFYGFAKFLIFFVLFLLMFILFTDNSPAIKRVFAADHFAFLSKLSICVFLIYPTVMFFLYCSGSAGVNISYPTIIYAAAHHILVGYLLSYIITDGFLDQTWKIVDRIRVIIT